MAERIQPIRLLVSVMAAIMLLVTLVTPLGSSGTANASTAALTVATDGENPPLASPTTSGSGWSYEVSAGVGTLTVTGTASVKGDFIRDRLSEAPLTIVAADIDINDDILGAEAHRLTLKSAGNIILRAGKSVTTSGGDVIFWAHSGVAGDDTASSGHIALLSGSSVNTGTGAGDIIFGGGTSATDGVPTGFVFGARATSLVPPQSPSGGTAAVLLDRSNVTAGTGAIRAKAHGTGSGSNLQTGFWVNRGQMLAAVIEIEGNGSTISRTTHTGQDLGIYVMGASMTASQSLSLTGKGGTSNKNTTDRLQIGVGIYSGVNSEQNTWDNAGSRSSLTATGSGSITVKGTGGSSSSKNDIPDFPAGVQVAPNQIISAQTGDISFTGEAGHRGHVALSIGSPLSTSGTISLTAVASTAGGGAGRAEVNVSRITASALRLFGPGEFAITNPSNAIGTIAAGSPTHPVGKLSVFDSTGGLTIGTVGGLSGLHSTGDILVETGTGDINLTEDITTDSAIATAITLNAGRDASANNGEGGDIIVSGSPAITTGNNGRARFFSGTEARSAGLNDLKVNGAPIGAANTRFGVDKTTTVFIPALNSQTSYALYRLAPSGGITLYMSGPLVAGAEVEGTNGVDVFRETFDAFSGLNNGDNCHGAGENLGLAVGTLTASPVTACKWESANQWGGAIADDPAPRSGTPTAAASGTPFLTVPSSATDDDTITFSFTSPVKYVGFWWSAGDDGGVGRKANTVEFLAGDPLNNPRVIATLDASDLETLLYKTPETFAGSNGPWPGSKTVTSIGGTVYPAGHYFGNPRGFTAYPPTAQSGTVDGGTSHRVNIYAYLNLFLNGEQEATGVRFSGRGFEFDNLTTSTLVQSPVSSLVFVQGVLGRTVDFRPGADGVTGFMPAQVASEGVSTNLNPNSFVRTGFQFTGWNTEPDGTGTAFTPGAPFNFSSDLVLFAQWEAVSSGSGAQGSSGTSTTTRPSAGSSLGAGGSAQADSSSRPPGQTRPFPRVPAPVNTAPVTQPVVRSGLTFDPNAAARATRGGSLTNLVTTPDGSSGLSLSAGAFRIGVNVAGVGEVQTDTPSRSPELFLPRGQSAGVSGGGSYPGSFVQLWLTGNGSDSRELARIPVGPDGSFTSNFSLSPGSLDMPVPIGRQVLQVVGYDEAGNQTVVDMTINIGQGVPAPEPNREAGALPALAFGQSLATSGGIPERVSLTGLPDTGTVAVEGDGWLISVTASRDNGVVENSDGNVLVRLNQSSVGIAEGRGFLAGTLATVWLFSDPTLVSTVTVDEDGQFAAEFLVDARLIAPGEHTLQVQGVGHDGYIKAANLGVLVEQPMAVTSGSASSMLFWILGLALLALVIVFWFVIARRRRNQEV